MAFLRRINLKAKTAIDTGFGSNNSNYGGRFINKDGMPNVEKIGVGFFESISWFHTMLSISGFKFYSIIFLFYITVNLFFAGMYLAIGVEHLGGLTANTTLEKFGEVYFFSAQTFTTVGYGRINPTGFATSAMAAIEALVGLLSFALATGLLYGRFSRPQAYIKFSENAILAPFKDGIALMMRIVPFKNNNLTDVEAKLSAGIMLEENGNISNKFFLMDLEYSRVNSLTLSWTIVHPITEDSPFYKFSLDDFKNIDGEIFVFIKAFDDMFSNTVVIRTSYKLSEIITGAIFNPVYYRNKENSKTILDINKLNSFDLVKIDHFINKEK